MELNDQVQVKLTASGASRLNVANMLDKIGRPSYKINYKEGDIYKDQLWRIFNVFGGRKMIAGNDVSFTDLKPVNNA